MIGRSTHRQCIQGWKKCSGQLGYAYGYLWLHKSSDAWMKCGYIASYSYIDTEMLFRYSCHCTDC